MNDDTVRYVVAGIGTVTVAAGLYNLVSMPETGREGVFDTFREAQETHEWVVSASAVNSVAFVLVGVAVALLAVYGLDSE